MRPINVVAAVIRHEGQILACRRKPGKAAAGRWEFPGGKIESDETAPEALRREIQEELGVPITVLEQLNSHVTQVGEIRINLICYFAELDADLPFESTDHDELRWVDPANLRQFAWAEPDLPAVSALLNRFAKQANENPAI